MTSTYEQPKTNEQEEQSPAASLLDTVVELNCPIYGFQRLIERIEASGHLQMEDVALLTLNIQNLNNLPTNPDPILKGVAHEVNTLTDFYNIVEKSEEPEHQYSEEDILVANNNFEQSLKRLKNILENQRREQREQQHKALDPTSLENAN